MPEHLKNTPNLVGTKEFQKYLKSFVKNKEKQHRHKLLQEIATSVSLMIAG